MAFYGRLKDHRITRIGQLVDEHAHRRPDTWAYDRLKSLSTPRVPGCHPLPEGLDKALGPRLVPIPTRASSLPQSRVNTGSKLDIWLSYPQREQIIDTPEETNQARLIRGLRGSAGSRLDHRHRAMLIQRRDQGSESGTALGCRDAAHIPNPKVIVIVDPPRCGGRHRVGCLWEFR